MLYKFLIHRICHFYSYITFCIQGLTLIVRVILIPKNVRKKQTTNVSFPLEYALNRLPMSVHFTYVCCNRIKCIFHEVAIKLAADKSQ